MNGVPEEAAGQATIVVDDEVAEGLDPSSSEQIIQTANNGTTTTTKTTDYILSDETGAVSSSVAFSWIVWWSSAISSLARPVLILVCGMLLFNLPILLYKIRLAFQGILYLLFCHDKSWKKPSDPAPIFAKAQSDDNHNKVQSKTIYFVRHGESTWNDTFNKGKHRSTLVFVVGFIPGLIKAMLYELYLLLSGKMDSWFYDSPCSHLGLYQVDALAQFLSTAKPTSEKEKVYLSVLRAQSSSSSSSPDMPVPTSKVLCSPLRRAITTMAGGFRERWARSAAAAAAPAPPTTITTDDGIMANNNNNNKNSKEMIMLHPSLQEISRNPDTLCLTPPYAPKVIPSWIDRTSRDICDFDTIFTQQIDTSLHSGNKPLHTNGYKRMKDFCDTVFEPSFSPPEEHIIVGGHSIWFRSFFRTFLPYTSQHVSKQNKIVNCGVVALKLMKTLDSNGQAVYMIDPESVDVIYGGF